MELFSFNVNGYENVWPALIKVSTFIYDYKDTLILKVIMYIIRFLFMFRSNSKFRKILNYWKNHYSSMN